MSTLKVFLYEEVQQGSPALLLDRLVPGIELRHGREAPDPADYEILIAAFPPRELLEASPRLQALIVPFAGPPLQTQHLLADFPDLAVHNTPYNALATAETAVALLLGAAKFLVHGDSRLRQGDWTLRYSVRPQIVLHGRTVVILGFGRIGRHAGQVCRALGMHVIGVRRALKADDKQTADVELHAVDALATVLPRADALLCALPETPETIGLVGADELALLRDDAIVVNVGRGSVIDEDALYQALTGGKLAAAGLDVWYNYPRTVEARTSTLPSRHPFHELENVILSPHRGGWLGSEDDSRMAMLAEMLNTAAAGRPLPNPVDPSLGY